MSDIMIYDAPDFEPASPSTPADLLHDIIDLARQCYEQRKAYVYIEISGNQKVSVTVTKEIVVADNEFIEGYTIAPKKWDSVERLVCTSDDAHYLNGVVIKLQQIVGGEV